MVLRQTINPATYPLYACLPFVELGCETIVHIGPVIFWPASKAHKFLDEKDRSALHHYLDSIGQMKVPTFDKKTKLVSTGRLSSEATTCVSISDSILPEWKEFVLIDALYLLYFACTFKNLYFRQEMPSFNALRKLIPCSIEFINTPQQWDSLYIDDAYREDAVCINLVDEEICNGLGKALDCIYHPSDFQNEQKEHLQGCQRLVRAIRFIVDCYFQRFVNLFDKGLTFSDNLFDAEHFIFLVSAFDALFDINDTQPAADFKQKLRALLHLKHSSSLELFWKWVDDFYDVKRRIVRGDVVLDSVFRGNPNFEVAHMFLGIKLFIYSIYYTLFQLKLIELTHEDSFVLPDFKWIHPEEFFVFLWSEATLLKKLNLFLKQAQEGLLQSEILADIHFMTQLFVLMYERYYHEPHRKDIRFIPASLADLSDSGESILELLRQEQAINANGSLLRAVHCDFIPSLKGRLEDKKKADL